MRQSPIWRALAGLFLLSSSVGCVRVSNESNSIKDGVVAQAEYAKGFAWLESSHGIPVLAIRQPRTGTWLATVSKSPLSVTDSVPIVANHHVVLGEETQGFVTSSTTHVHLLNAGVGLENWRGCTSLHYLRDSTLLHLVDSMTVRDVKGDGGWNVEVMTALSPAWILTGPEQDLSERGWPWVPMTEYLEPHPLGRAEWMIPLAWMAGDSASGWRAFQSVRDRYEELAVPFERGAKRILTGSIADGVWHAPGQSSFVAQWIRDAGGSYALSRDDLHANVQLGLEKMLEEVSNVDAWVVVLYDPDGVDEGDIQSLDPRHFEVMRMVNEIWVCNTAEVDYFGEVVAHPEWVLEDMAALVNEEQRGPHGLFAKLNFNPLPR